MAAKKKTATKAKKKLPLSAYMLKKQAMMKAEEKKFRKLQEDPVFILQDGIPEERYGLSEKAYESLVSQLKGMKVDKNQLIVPYKNRSIVRKIMNKKFPEYSVKGMGYQEKDIYAFWRKA